MRREYAKERARAAADAAKRAAFVAAHSQWVKMVDEMPNHLQQTELEWHAGRIKAAEMWGSDNDPNMYLQRIEMLRIEVSK